MAELDVNEGIVPLIEMRFPEPGTLLTPVFPAPTNARTFVILRLLGVLAGVIAKAVDGRMPADQETIRYTGVYGEDRDGRSYLMREVLGGGSGGRSYADGEDTIHVVPDSRNLPSEFTESRFPFVVESLSLAVDSGGAGEYRGGLGYEKQIRMLKDAHFMSIADRSILRAGASAAAWPARRSRSPSTPAGPREREVDALADAEPVRGRRGDPDPHDRRWRLGRPARRDPEAVVRDVVWRKVSPEAALASYGVVLTGSLDGGDLGHDADATAAERASRPARERGVLRPRPRLRPAGRRRAARRRRRPLRSSGRDAYDPYRRGWRAVGGVVAGCPDVSGTPPSRLLVSTALTAALALAAALVGQLPAGADDRRERDPAVAAAACRGAAKGGVRPDRLQDALEMPAAYPFQPKLRVYPDRPDAADAGNLLAHHDLAPLLNQWMAQQRPHLHAGRRPVDRGSRPLPRHDHRPGDEEAGPPAGPLAPPDRGQPREGGAQQAAGRRATSSRSGSAPTSTATSGRAPTPRCR